VNAILASDEPFILLTRILDINSNIYLMCGVQFRRQNLTIPVNVKRLCIWGNPQCPLPELLTSLDLNYCLGPDIIYAMNQVENECPNLITLHVRSNLSSLLDDTAPIIIERTGPSGFSSNIIFTQLGILVLYSKSCVQAK